MNRMNKRVSSRLAGIAANAVWTAILGGGVISCIMVGVNRVPVENVEAGAELLTATVQTYHTDAVRLVSCDVPDGDTYFKSYMGFTSITNKDSEQYRLQKECWTDKHGLRRCDDDYVIALGSYYTSEIGERFKITLDTGESFTAVVGDFKADAHTDSLHQYTPTSDRGKCVLEFVVDTKALDSTAKRMGDISYISGFSGDVEKIEKYE